MNTLYFKIGWNGGATMYKGLKFFLKYGWKYDKFYNSVEDPLSTSFFPYPHRDDHSSQVYHR